MMFYFRSSSLSCSVLWSEGWADSSGCSVLGQGYQGHTSSLRAAAQCKDTDPAASWPWAPCCPHGLPPLLPLNRPWWGVAIKWMVPNRARQAGLPGEYEKLLLQLINLQEKKVTINIFRLQVDVLSISSTEASFTPILRDRWGQVSSLCFAFPECSWNKQNSEKLYTRMPWLEGKAYFTLGRKGLATENYKQHSSCNYCMYVCMYVLLCQDQNTKMQELPRWID